MNSISGMSAGELALITLVFGGIVGIIIMLIYLINYIICAVGYWKMFEKAGEKGWKALIPVYNEYVMFDIAWDAKYFWYYLGSYILSVFLTAETMIFSLILLAASIAVLYFNIKMKINLSRAYGFGIGMGLLFVFLPFVASLIVGFGDSAYHGKQY